MKYDFGGWATRNDLQCADGRVRQRAVFSPPRNENPLADESLYIHSHLHISVPCACNPCALGANVRQISEQHFPNMNYSVYVMELCKHILQKR